MKTLFLWIAALGLLATGVWAGEIGYASGASCTASGDVVSCSTVVGRGTLVIEASEDAFIKLRDALTPNWTGTMVCTQCDVEQGFPGCVAAGDEVVTTRKKAALSKLACLIKGRVIYQDIRDAEDAISVDTNPDIGGGDPG